VSLQSLLTRTGSALQSERRAAAQPTTADSQDTADNALQAQDVTAYGPIRRSYTKPAHDRKCICSLPFGARFHCLGAEACFLIAFGLALCTIFVLLLGAVCIHNYHEKTVNALLVPQQDSPRDYVYGAGR